MWDFSLLLLHWLQCSVLLSYIVRDVFPTYKEPSFTSFNSFSPPAPSLHLEQMFSYTSDDLVHCGRTSAFWLQVVQSPLPHAVPSHKLFSGNLLFSWEPLLSTIFTPKPILGANFFVNSFSLLASSAPAVFSTNRTDLYWICSSAPPSCC